MITQLNLNLYVFSYNNNNFKTLFFFNIYVGMQNIYLLITLLISQKLAVFT